MSVQRFRKRPVEVNAIHYDGEFPLDFLGDAASVRLVGGAIVIHTPEGDMRAEIGDWIIRGVQGEFYPCKPEIFAQTYEAVPTPRGRRTV